REGRERLDAHVLLALPDRETGGAALDRERGCLAVELREDEDLLGVTRDRDEALAAVQHEIAAASLRACGEIRGVEADARLDDGGRGRTEAAAEAGQERAALGLVAEIGHGVGEEARCEQVERDREIAPSELLCDDGS